MSARVQGVRRVSESVPENGILYILQNAVFRHILVMAKILWNFRERRIVFRGWMVYNLNGIGMVFKV